MGSKGFNFQQMSRADTTLNDFSWSSARLLLLDHYVWITKEMAALTLVNPDYVFARDFTACSLSKKRTFKSLSSPVCSVFLKVNFICLILAVLVLHYTFYFLFAYIWLRLLVWSAWMYLKRSVKQHFNTAIDQFLCFNISL